MSKHSASTSYVITLMSILGGTFIIPILQMKTLSFTDVGKLDQVHTINEFDFKPTLLTVMLCCPLVFLWVTWKASECGKPLEVRCMEVSGRGKTYYIRVPDEGPLLLKREWYHHGICLKRKWSVDSPVEQISTSSQLGYVFLFFF